MSQVAVDFIEIEGSLNKTERGADYERSAQLTKIE